MTRETIVVFGGSGFIGGHLLRRMANQGATNLISVDLREPGVCVDGVTYLTADVRDLSKLKIDGQVKKIYNFAAVHTTPGHEPWEYYETNVRGALQVTRFAQRHGCTSIVFTSSISVYGPNETSKDESTIPTPNSDYGRSKLIAETLHEDWVAQSDAHRLVIVRPAVVFGAGEGGNFTRLARMLEKGVFVYPGRKDTIKSCIYVKDLLEWIGQAEKMKERCILFNGSYSNRYTIEEIVETFRAVAFPKARTFLVPGGALRAIAAVLRPLSATGIGIHPDRITKLMVSTNILPSWAEAQDFDTRDRLEFVLQDWKNDTLAEFT